MATKRKPRHEAFPPGIHIREEIEERGWSQGDLARIMGRPVQVVNEIINGRKAITAQTAYELEAALGPSAVTWMNLETSWQLYRAGRPNPEIATRAKEHEKTVARRLASTTVTKCYIAARKAHRNRNAAARAAVDDAKVAAEDFAACARAAGRGKTAKDRAG
jgi:addiction module HigA family antidote